MSSLPALQFDDRPALSYGRFVEACRGFVDDEVVRTLEMIGSGGIYGGKAENPVLRRWLDFEVPLRDELVKIRSSRKHVDPEKYIRGSGQADMSVSRIAMNAHRSRSILESEGLLDRARWDKLDELEDGHYLDLDNVIVYALKLLISVKRQNAKDADRPAVLEAALSGGENSL